MEPKLLETTLDGHRPARRTCWRALAEALRERKAGKANTFKRVTASVSPVINTGWQTATQHGNRTGNRARPSESGDWVTFNPRTTDIEPSDVDASPLHPGTVHAGTVSGLRISASLYPYAKPGAFNGLSNVPSCAGKSVNSANSAGIQTGSLSAGASYYGTDDNPSTWIDLQIDSDRADADSLGPLATVGTSCRLIEKTRKDQYEQYEQYEMGFYDPENAAPALGPSTVSNLLKTPLIILYRTAVTAVDLL